MNPIDDAVLTAFPLLPVPVEGPIPEAAGSGTRFLVGRDGISRETCLPWLRVRELVAPSALALPYGSVPDSVEFLCGPVPDNALRQAMEHARQALPQEVAGALLWNAGSFGWRYQPRATHSAGPTHVAYEEVVPGEDEHLVVDVHSHGCHAAFFSDADDADDAGAMKLSLVLGNLDRLHPSSRMRLCLAGVVRTAYIRSDGELAVLA